MPWTLYYPHATHLERITARVDLERFRRSRQVSSVACFDNRPEADLVAEISFVDEEKQTRSRTLLRIRRDHGTPIRPVVREALRDAVRNIISESIRTQAGRETLARSLTVPLRARLDYQGIARRTFLVDALPPGALPTYDREPQLNFYDTGIDNSRGANPCGEIPLTSNPVPVEAPEWAVPGVWIHSPSTGEYAEITAIRDLSADISFWRPENGRVAKTWIAKTVLGSVWLLSERPKDPEPAWVRLLQDEELYLRICVRDG